MGLINNLEKFNDLIKTLKDKKPDANNSNDQKTKEELLKDILNSQQTSILE